jgi:integrin alpha FG-GAP repeat containing protein 1
MQYAFMGIGRSNNYIETFTASTSANGKRAKRMWTPIIPNSSIVIFAHTAETDVSSWGVELFISPTQSLYITVLVCIACLILIGMWIVYLHCREK